MAVPAHAPKPAQVLVYLRVLGVVVQRFTHPTIVIRFALEVTVLVEHFKVPFPLEILAIVPRHVQVVNMGG